MAEYILGFDFRFSFASYVPTAWPRDRRELYLLRPELDTPASVDPLVWPSLFLYPGDFVARHPDGMQRIHVTPEHILQHALGLWPDFESMAQVVEAARDDHDLIATGIVAAITLVEQNSLATDKGWAALVDTTATSEPSSDTWSFLGYDVADGGFISGLSNCGYDPIERSAFQHLWGSRLNGYGLLRSVADAVEFCELSNGRVPEHQPFYIYGLYRRI